MSGLRFILRWESEPDLSGINWRGHSSVERFLSSTSDFTVLSSSVKRVDRQFQRKQLTSSFWSIALISPEENNYKLPYFGKFYL